MQEYVVAAVALFAWFSAGWSLVHPIKHGAETPHYAGRVETAFSRILLAAVFLAAVVGLVSSWAARDLAMLDLNAATKAGEFEAIAKAAARMFNARFLFLSSFAAAIGLPLGAVHATLERVKRLRAKASPPSAGQTAPPG